MRLEQAGLARPSGIASGLRGRRRQRFALLDDVVGENFKHLARNRARIVRRVGWNLEGIASLEGLVRLACDLEDESPFNHIAALDTRMGMAARAGAGRDFHDGALDVVARREIDGLQRRALDGGLLGDRRTWSGWNQPR